VLFGRHTIYEIVKKRKIERKEFKEGEGMVVEGCKKT